MELWKKVTMNSKKPLSPLYISLIIAISYSESTSAHLKKQDNFPIQDPFGNYQIESSTVNSSEYHCPPWSHFDVRKKICRHNIYYAALFYNNHTYLTEGYCSTYNESTQIVSFAPCPYFQSDDFDVQFKLTGRAWYIKLPVNVSILNNYMCGPLNRQGRVCSECIDGFGPAVTSVGFNIQCSNCTDVWYGIPLYLALEIIPVTIFYLVILIFRINITSAPMTSYIMYSQLVIIWWNFAFEGEDYHISQRMFELNQHTELFQKVIFAIYDVWNLRFYHYWVPPFCISNRLQPFHFGLLGYISILYPMCLIALTWVCVELHGRNFKLLVWLWKPLHKCFVTLRRGWDSKSDMIDVFSSFFLLSFTKIMYQTALFMAYQTIENKHYDNFKLLDEDYVTMIDLTVKYGSTIHLMYLIPATLLACIFNVLPIALLLLYPFKVFRACLSRCRLDRLVLKHFVDKFYGCYRDGTGVEGGMDMRSFAALHFLLRLLLLSAGPVASLMTISNTDPYFPRNVIAVAASLLTALCRPYKKTYMNVLDTLLLAHFGLSCHLVSSYPGFVKHTSFVYTFEAMCAFPFFVFVFFISLKVVQKARNTRVYAVLSQKCRNRCLCRDTIFQCKNSTLSCCSLPIEQPLVEHAHSPEVSTEYNNRYSITKSI